MPDPFDLAWDFRATVPFVTDPNFAVPETGATYPYLYTNANGDSLSAGWVDPPKSIGGENSGGSNDPRIAGDMYTNLNVANIFRVDLSSGSAPGVGWYLVDVAIGGGAYGYDARWVLNDDSTPLITGTNGTLAVNHFQDASLADVAGSATWGGTPVLVQVTSTTLNLVQTSTASKYVAIAHFRLTKQEAGGPVETVTLALAGMA